MSRARAALAVAALTVAGAAGLAVAPAMASEGGTSPDAITVSQPTATDYSFTLNVAGAGIQINYTIDATGQVTGASIGTVTPAPVDPNAPSGSSAQGASTPVDPTTGLSTMPAAVCTAQDPTSTGQQAVDSGQSGQSAPTSLPTLSCTGSEITLTLADNTVVKVELGDGGTSVEEVHASGPSAPTESTDGQKSSTEKSTSESTETEQSRTQTSTTGSTETEQSGGTSHDSWNSQDSTKASSGTDGSTPTTDGSSSGSDGSYSGSRSGSDD